MYSINTVSFHKDYTPKKSKPLKYHSRKTHQLYKKNNSLFIMSIAIIFITSFLTVHRLYVNTNCTDLCFSVEYNFTSRLISKNKLIRVQHMSIISKDNNTAVIEVFGLSKSKPHKSTSLKGTFTKTTDGVWNLSSIDN